MTARRRARAVLACASLLLASIAGAQESDARLRWVPNPRAGGASWVSDPASHLQPATVATIDSIITALQRETTTEIAVVVIDSLDGLDSHAAAFTLHRRWGVGERARSNGVVFLWSPALRQTYVSVGTGLEGVLPDAVAGRLQDDHVIPHFRRGEFDEGMIAGVRAIAAAARGETYAGRPAGGARGGAAGIVSTILQVGLAIIVAIGALLGWRNRPRRCPRGHGFMRKLSESADNAALGREELVEEQLGSIDHDVWQCRECGERLVVSRTKWWNAFSRCPECKRRTVKKTTKVLLSATRSRAGNMRVTQTCKNCGWTKSWEQVLPIITESSSGSGGGGGFSSSGGGGFGGGSSSGGGAGRSY